jgi:hypothetical protein
VQRVKAAAIGTWRAALSWTIAGVKTRCGGRSMPQEDMEWFTCVLELAYHGLADFRFYEAPAGSVVSTHKPHLGVPQARVVALWS